MKYKLKKNYTTDPEAALEEILRDRGLPQVCRSGNFLLYMGYR